VCANFISSFLALLNTKENLDKFRAISVTKKPYGNQAITPIHTAALNPNSKYLKDLTAIRPEYTILDGTK